MGGDRKKGGFLGEIEIRANKWLLRDVEAMILVNQSEKTIVLKYQGDEYILPKYRES